ncbi:MAG TPA: hypothetical protein ENK33_02175 [Desulfobacterales bacterium]|nr:hypothetical protein [Desulfobacterales bacterium]
MKRMQIMSLTLVLLMAGVAACWAQDGLKFPLRSQYSSLRPIDTKDLAAIYNKAIIVDARNKKEYKVLHMKGAHNFLVGKMKEKDLLGLRSKDGTTPMIFYCNGITCAKSYKATTKAAKWGFKNIRVYDAGVFHWAMKHPERAVFFGKPLTAELVATKIISGKKLAAKMLAAPDFIRKARSGKYTVFDVRDANERSATPIRLAKMRSMPFDTMVTLLDKGSKAVPKKSILIFDNVGKQVKWLQYYLRQAGVTDYFFLKGGVRQWVKDGYNARGVK